VTQRKNKEISNDMLLLPLEKHYNSSMIHSHE